MVVPVNVVPSTCRTAESPTVTTVTCTVGGGGVVVDRPRDGTIPALQQWNTTDDGTDDGTAMMVPLGTCGW